MQAKKSFFSTTKYFLSVLAFALCFIALSNKGYAADRVLADGYTDTSLEVPTGENCYIKDGGVIINGDVTVRGNLNVCGDLGNLTVNGDLYVVANALSVYGYGELTVNGNIYITGTGTGGKNTGKSSGAGKLQQSSSNSVITCNSLYIYSKEATYLRAGILNISGDLIIDDNTANKQEISAYYGEHVIYFKGTGDHKYINPRTDTCPSVVKSEGPITLVGYFNPYSIGTDITINGTFDNTRDFYLCGHTLKVNGNAILENSLYVTDNNSAFIVSGDLYVTKGCLTVYDISKVDVAKDIYITGTATGSGYTKKSCGTGTISQRNASSIINCRNLYVYSQEASYFGAGTLNITGDLIVDDNDSNKQEISSYYGEHVMCFKGKDEHKYINPRTDTCPSIIKSDGPLAVTGYFNPYGIGTDITINGTLHNTRDFKVYGHKLIVNGEAVMENSIYATDDNSIFNVSENLYIAKGTLEVNGVSTVNVTKNIYITGTEVGTGNTKKSSGTGKIAQYNSASIINCSSLYIYSKEATYLRAGTLNITGDLIIDDNDSNKQEISSYYGDHALVFKGTGEHKIINPRTDTCPSIIKSDGPLVVTGYFNPYGIGTDITINGTLHNTRDFRVYGHVLTVNGEAIMENSIYATDNNSIFNVSENLYIAKGALEVNGVSTVNVAKNIYVTGTEVGTGNTKKSSGTGKIAQYNDASIINCSNLYMYSKEASYFRAGTLNITGDLIIDDNDSNKQEIYSYYGDHALVFKGESEHKYINPRTDTNPATIKSEGPLALTGYFNPYGLGSDIIINGTLNVARGFYVGGHTLTVNGDVVMNANINAETDGSKIIVSGNLNIPSGALTLRSGSIKVGGDLNVTEENYGKGTGYISTYGKANTVDVSGSLRVNSISTSYLKEGTVTVSGGTFLVKRNQTNEKSADAVFNSSVELTNGAAVSIGHENNKFNTLILDDDYKNYSFDIANCWNTLTLKKVSMNDCTFTIEYDKAIYDGKVKTPTVSGVLTANDTITIDPSCYTVSYANNKAIGTATATVTGTGVGYEAKNISFKIVPAKATVSSVTNGNKKITVKWKKVAGATGYNIYINNKKVAKVGNSSLSYTYSKSLKDGSKYSFAVQAICTKNGNTISGEKSEVFANYYLDKNKLSSVKSTAKGKVTVAYTTSKKVTGYQIQSSLDKNFTKSVKTYTISKNTVKSAAISKLTSKKKYYFRIRTFKTVSGKKYYSEWTAYSKAVTVK